MQVRFLDWSQLFVSPRLINIVETELAKKPPIAVDNYYRLEHKRLTAASVANKCINVNSNYNQSPS